MLIVSYAACTARAREFAGAAVKKKGLAMKNQRFKFAAGILALSIAAPTWAATPLHVLGAGTLAVPFKEINAAFLKKYPDAEVQAQFGGSVKMVKQVTELHQPADVVAVADYSVIPKYMFGANHQPRYADWYAGFAGNAITFVYTPKSKYAQQINSRNWYQYLAQPGVQIGRSNPDTDPSGYQTVQMLNLAGQFYHAPSLEAKVLANAPRTNIRDTETSLISALQLGQIDYLAIYRSDALQHHFQYIDLPPQINLSNPAYASFYAKGIAQTKNGTLTGKPIVYALTIPTNAEHKALAEKYVQFVLGPVGQAILKKDGFVNVRPALVVNAKAAPKSLHSLVKPWPGM